MRKNDYTFAGLLILIGVLFLLLNLKIINFEWLMFILSIGLIVGYFIKGHMGYLVSGLVLLGISLVSLLNQYAFPGVNIKGFLFLWIFGIISLVLYGRQGSRGFLVFGCILPALGTYNLIEELTFGDVSWTLYLLFGIAFYIIYMVGYRKSGIEWPKHLTIAMLIVSLLFLITSKSAVEFKFWKFINYLWPILLILIGVRIVYNIIKLKE